MIIPSIRQKDERFRYGWGFCLILLVTIISMWILPSANHAAEKTRKLQINNYINKLQAIPIPDSPGRVIGFYERLGDVKYENGETAKQILRCTFDMVRGIGPFQGYSQLTFENGATVLVKIEGVMTKPEEGKLPIGHGTGKYVEGTGRLKGIQGNIAFTVKMLKPYDGESKGDAVVDVTQTYTLPEK